MSVLAFNSFVHVLVGEEGRRTNVSATSNGIQVVAVGEVDDRVRFLSGCQVVKVNSVPPVVGRVRVCVFAGAAPSSPCSSIVGTVLVRV